jgi:hypothetical protein
MTLGAVERARATLAGRRAKDAAAAHERILLRIGSRAGQLEVTLTEAAERAPCGKSLSWVTAVARPSSGRGTPRRFSSARAISCT